VSELLLHRIGFLMHKKSSTQFSVRVEQLNLSCSLTVRSWLSHLGGYEGMIATYIASPLQV